ncbi:MIF4G domain-containing protein isoform X2 [Pyxicephalus adspersus]|uniref:MIF4G domain-containing protein isoform X2 n=1 Tax=Pyxicephalus adspersus TaxID=30357 RepID=UPI003B5937B5
MFSTEISFKDFSLSTVIQNMGEEYRIQVFDADTQNLLKTALKDPASVDLEKVADVIMEQSLRDNTFNKEAGKMCYTIIQAESKQTGRSHFRSALLNRLQREYQNREDMRARSVQEWVCYVNFICNVFDYLRVNNMPMMALVNPVYDCLFQLAEPESLKVEEEGAAIFFLLAIFGHFDWLGLDDRSPMQEELPQQPHGEPGSPTILAALILSDQAGRNAFSAKQPGLITDF